MELIDTSFHHIDHINNQTARIETASQSSQLNGYVSDLLGIITKANNKRSFTFKSNTAEVRAALDLMLNKKFEEGSEINVKRLLDIEKSAQDKYAHMTDIQKGILFQAFLMHEGKQTIIVSKADHSDFLDENELVLRRGLPLKKKLFKAMAVSFSPEESVETVFVIDTNRQIANYWWDSYLELRERYTDSYNTNKALAILDRTIFNAIKKKFPSDHTILRNSTIGYFRNQTTFDITHYTKSLLEEYQPVDRGLKPREMAQKILQLPEKGKFDRNFSVVKSEIKRKMISTISLTDSVELVLKDHISNLSGVIQAEEDKEGRKYIKIRTDEGYRRFRQ